MGVTTTAQARSLVIKASRILAGEAIFDSSGHVSSRIPERDAFVIPVRRAPALATEEGMLLIDHDGRVLEGDGPVPLEWPLHAEI